MKVLMRLLNGAPLPDWLKLLVLGAVVGIAIGVNQMSIRTLSSGQIEMKQEIIGLREDMRTILVPRAEFDFLKDRVSDQKRRLELLEERAQRGSMR